MVADCALDAGAPAHGPAAHDLGFDDGWAYGAFVVEEWQFRLGYDAGYGASDESTLGEITEAVLEDNTSRWSGNHLMSPDVVPGILLVNRKLGGSDYDLTDLTVTLLAHYGIEAPADMVGEAIAIQ